MQLVLGELEGVARWAFDLCGTNPSAATGHALIWYRISQKQYNADI